MGEADLKTVDMVLSSAGTAASQELAEVLESETLVDMTTLLSLCAHGIPDRLRGDAWKYLLGVQRPEKSDEMSLGRRMEQEYLELERAWTGPQSEMRQSDLRRRITREVRR